MFCSAESLISFEVLNCRKGEPGAVWELGKPFAGEAEIVSLSGY